MLNVIENGKNRPTRTAILDKNWFIKSKLSDQCAQVNSLESQSQRLLQIGIINMMLDNDHQRDDDDDNDESE